MKVLFTLLASMGYIIQLAQSASTTTVISKASTNECARITDGNFYDIGPLRRTEDYKVKFNPEDITDKDEEDLSTLYFNLCGPSLA